MFIICTFNSAHVEPPSISCFVFNAGIHSSPIHLRGKFEQMEKEKKKCRALENIKIAPAVGVKSITVIAVIATAYLTQKPYRSIIRRK